MGKDHLNETPADGLIKNAHGQIRSYKQEITKRKHNRSDDRKRNPLITRIIWGRGVDRRAFIYGEIFSA